MSDDNFSGLSLKEAIRAIRSTKQVHKVWYASTYPDVALLGMDPAEHYLKYGAAMGRNPGKGFDTNFYLETYPEVAKAGINPLLHYALHGEAKGYRRKSEGPRAADFGVGQVEVIRNKLLSLGFSEKPVEELEAVIADLSGTKASALAALELALWCMRSKTEENYRAAFKYIERARLGAPDREFRGRLTTMELLCYHYLQQYDLGHAAYETAALKGEITPDVLISYINYQRRPEARCTWINQVLGHYGIAPVTLLPDNGLSPYDRLTSKFALPAIEDGPKVTVLIASYNAADTLPTALRSLQEQTWKNLEILVIDDCSPDENSRTVVEAFAAQDPRISLIAMPRNGGAYVARNRGLELASGDYVTLHDADDWSHPSKIENQVRFMEATPEVMGCTSQQSRATANLEFTRLNSEGKLINLNTSSFMFRRQAVIDTCGGWDDVRFGADTELIKRMTTAFGKNCIKKLFNGPFSFQRISETSIVGDPHFGIEGFHYGVRFIYHEAYREYHSDRLVTNYCGGDGPEFCKPYPMRASRVKSSTPRHFDVINTSDFRMAGGSTRSSIEELKCHQRNGLDFAIYHLFRYDFETKRSIFSVLKEDMNLRDLDVLGYGETATCDLLIIRYPPVLQYLQRYVPKIIPKRIKVIVNQTPMSDYGPNGEVRFTFKECAENIRRYFDMDATWHPIGPLVRDVLMERHAGELQHIDLSDQDWTNIIDVAGWARGARRRGPGDRLRIGRHSREQFVKWPATKEEMLTVYPASDDIEVHVLGGASTPAAVLGGLPDNWTVHEFGALHPKDFLADIDVFVYFSHPDWVESFGRTIIEAMAVGVPVILPEVYRPLFKDAALYATPQTAVDLARRLHADPDRYNERAAYAQKFVADNFSYEMHMQRLEL